MENIAISADQIQYFFLVFVRISTMIALLPIYGSQSIPPQLKVAFSILLTIIIFSTLTAASKVAVPVPGSVGILFLLIVKEAMIGLAIGFVTTFLFAAVQVAGYLVDMEMGFGMTQVMDPLSDDMITPFAQFQVIIFTILFLSFNGHYFLLLAVEKSFELIPLGQVHLHTGGLLLQFTRMVSDIFIVGIKLSAPIYVTLILSEFAMGIVARTVPQINIFFVGLPMKIMVGLGTAFIVLPMLGLLFRKIVEGLVQDIWRVLYLMA